MDAWTDFLLKNPSAIVGLLAILVTVYFAIRQSQRVDFKAFVLHTEPLFSMVHEEQAQFTVHYKDKIVDDVWIIRVKVKYRGRLPITREDFVEPLQFNFGTGSYVLYRQHVRSKPKEISATLSFHGSDETIKDTTFVRLEPLLLNPGATLFFRIVVAESNYNCTPTGIIKGNPTIHPSPYITRAKDLFKLHKWWPW